MFLGHIRYSRYYELIACVWQANKNAGKMISLIQLLITIIYYYMATIVRALWLAAERARFSCNDQALWQFFLAQRFFWVESKSDEHVGKNNKKCGQSTTIFSITDVLTSLSLSQCIKASVWDFPVMTSLSVNKWYLNNPITPKLA